MRAAVAPGPKDSAVCLVSRGVGTGTVAAVTGGGAGPGVTGLGMVPRGGLADEATERMSIWILGASDDGGEEEEEVLTMEVETELFDIV